MKRDVVLELIMRNCSCCEKECEEYYWENIFKGFCSLACTNEYLESEGFETISGPDESAPVKPEYRAL